MSLWKTVQRTRAWFRCLTEIIVPNTLGGIGALIWLLNMVPSLVAGVGHSHTGPLGHFKSSAHPARRPAFSSSQPPACFTDVPSTDTQRWIREWRSIVKREMKVHLIWDPGISDTLRVTCSEKCCSWTQIARASLDLSFDLLHVQKEIVPWAHWRLGEQRGVWLLFLWSLTLRVYLKDNTSFFPPQTHLEKVRDFFYMKPIL